MNCPNGIVRRELPCSIGRRDNLDALSYDIMKRNNLHELYPVPLEGKNYHVLW
jgi:hypothetical protein